ncbi:MAG: DUF1501 domain-containing protein [Planctomycetaceae bacterium]|nr:DUF1501 domain-containing protein [Planctomycetales bacterium]MCB9922712.1 DUF1501 domain-containing protein [Planctomycetaceae bacterium]
MLRTTLTRRQLLAHSGAGAGLLGLSTLLNSEGLLSAANDASPLDPLAPRPPHFHPKAKAVIWLFINGGPSHVDTWDHKPELERSDGKELEGFDKFTGFFSGSVGPLMKSPFAFAQHGECGKWVSDIFPNLSQHVDKMAFVHSAYAKSNNHSPALFMANTGFTQMGYPCVGSWATYGLGSESRDLPAFVVMSDPKGRGLPKGYSLNWGAGFLPSVYQGTWLKPSGDPIDNLNRPAALNESRQRAQLDLLAQLNRDHLEENPAEKELAARIESFELAYRMQSAAPEALDIDDEPQHIQTLYGLDDERCAHFSKQCLIARRMVERGVRFVQIYSGGMENQRSWDGHNDIQGNHSQFAGETDKPIAALLGDLAQRGLLDSTLVVWGGEFGRLPVAQKSAKPGRDHNPNAMTYWFAGGGAKGGTSYGATDEVGHKAVDDRVNLHDLHATILHLLGMNHKQLTYRHNGRDFRLTDVEGEVIHEIIS